jgi:hypothetical protein
MGMVEAWRMTFVWRLCIFEGRYQEGISKKVGVFPVFNACICCLLSLMTLFSDVRSIPPHGCSYFIYHHPVTYPPTSFWVCCLIVCVPAYMYPTPPSRYVLPSCSLTTPILLGVSFGFTDTHHDSSGSIFPTVFSHAGGCRPCAS